MHIDYAREKLEYYRGQAEKHEWKSEKDEMWLSMLFSEKEFINFLIEFGNEKTRSIAETIKKSTGNRYFKVTAKQKFSVTKDILSRFTAEDILERVKFNS